MAVPASGNQLSLQGIRRELETNNYSATNTYTNISLEDLIFLHQYFTANCIGKIVLNLFQILEREN